MVGVVLGREDNNEAELGSDCNAKLSGIVLTYINPNYNIIKFLFHIIKSLSN